MLAWVFILIILICACIYVLLTPKDVDPYFISNQASISSTKQSGESAVFRSLANDHGRALLGSMHPLNQFKFKHLWEDSESFRISYVSKTGRITAVENLPALIGRVQQAIHKYPPKSEISMSFDVGIEALVAYLAVVLSGRIPRLPGSQIPEDDSESNDSDATIENTAILRKAEFKFAQESTGIEVLQDSQTSVVVPIFGTEVESYPPLTIVDTKPEFEALRIDKDISISQVDMGVAIAAQLTALGSQHRWSHNDTVYVAPGPFTGYTIVTMLTALSAKSKLLFSELGPMMPATTVLQRAKPTVLVSDDLSMRSLSKQVDDFQLVSWLQYGLRRLRMSRGCLMKPGMISGFSSVRIIHTATGTDPFQWLDNNEMANLRILTGCQFIHTYTPDDGLPVCQTVVGDYRSSKKLPGVVLGPPLPGSELKKRGNDLLLLRANHSKWQKINGNCTADAKLSKDGCLYVPEKRQDFSDYYYYTGELK